MTRKYSWLSDPEPIVQPLTRDARPFEEARADRLSRPLPAAAPSPLHRHGPACLVGEEIRQPATNLYPPIRLRQCTVQGTMAFLDFVE